MVLHPVMFSWHQNSSLKADPEAETYIKILEHLLVDGFVSSGDELLVAPLLNVDHGRGNGDGVDYTC